MGKVLIKLENISKKFNNKYVVKNINLEVYEGEFLTLLGSSGCGKTTILRMISGLENVTEGKIFIDDKDVTNLDPAKREVNTIFQNFALFPHMTVYQNIEFGLKMKKVPKGEISKRVKSTLKLVKLEGLEDRVPAQLSGGQQQRVALARGLIMNPKVLLLDESLCSLDLKLKRKMQIELKKIQKKSGITFIYVTHDQDEALTMSDRIVIINNGVIEQNDTPPNIYRHPKTIFVADFIGESNILESEVFKISKDVAEVKVKDNFDITINNYNYSIGDKLKLVIRPENIKISKNYLKEGLEAKIIDKIYDGSFTKIIVNIDGIIDLKVITNDYDSYKEGDNIYLKIDKNEIVPIKGKNNEKTK